MVIVTRIPTYAEGESFVFNSIEQANKFIEHDFNTTVEEEKRESEFLDSYCYHEEIPYACITWAYNNINNDDKLEWMITYDNPNIVAIEAYNYDYMKRLP